MSCARRACDFECRFLCPQPRKDIAALAACCPGPAQVLQRFALFACPPIFFGHHERPSPAARVRQGEYLDREAMFGTHDAVSLALELDSIELPTRKFQARIGC